MRTYSKLLLAGLTAALLLSMAVASATANRLSVSNRNFRVVWIGLELEGDAVEPPIRCNVTMEGSFHSATLRKVVGALIGHISRATAASCTNGSATVSQEALPWHVRYRNFSGTLPNITLIGLDLINAKFRVQESGGLTCTTQTTATNPGQGEAKVAAGVITEMQANEEARIPLRGSFLCEIAGDGWFRGNGSVTLLGTTASITVRLI